MSATYRPNHAGMRRMLTADWMELAMRNHAEGIKLRAEALAPVGSRGDEHAGRYKASFHIRTHVSYSAPGRYGGGRAEAIVYNDAPEAIFVEFGHRGREPFGVLKRAAFG